jgi:hypothetical protein
MSEFGRTSSRRRRADQRERRNTVANDGKTRILLDPTSERTLAIRPRAPRPRSPGGSSAFSTSQARGDVFLDRVGGTRSRGAEVVRFTKPTFATSAGRSARSPRAAMRSSKRSPIEDRARRAVYDIVDLESGDSRRAGVRRVRSARSAAVYVRIRYRTGPTTSFARGAHAVGQSSRAWLGSERRKPIPYRSPRRFMRQGGRIRQATGVIATMFVLATLLLLLTPRGPGRIGPARRDPALRR